MKLLFMFLSLLHLSAGDPRLVCPETVVTRIGGNVVLPCHLEPEENIQYGKVEVTKVDLDALVYAYYNGRQLADFYEPYKHRMSLNTEELKNGVLNLKINSVTQSDNGKFRISILKWRINSTVNLIVGDPRLVCPETVEARIGDNVVLPCHVEPEENIQNETIDCKLADSNQLVYARRNGKELPDQLARYKHRTSLDFEDLKVGVLNLKINSVTQSDNGTYQFYIHTWRINSTVTLIVEPADLKRSPETHGSSSADTSLEGVRPPRVHLGVIVGVIGVALFLGVVILFLVKRKKIQTRRRQQETNINTELQETTTWIQDRQHREGPC